MSQSIGGGRYEVRGPQRESRVGTWHLLSDPDGHPRGGLRLNALNDAEWERLEGTLRIDLPSLLNVVDQVRDETGRWLVTTFPAAPTVAQVLAARIPLPEALTLLIAVDTGQTLAALHESQQAHGALTTDAVVLSGEGKAVLAECGYAHALAGTTPGPGHDVTAWVKLLRDLATPRPQDRAKQLLMDAADKAEALGGSTGLTTALAALAEQAAQINGYGERSALAVLAALVPPTAPPLTTAALHATIPPPAAAPQPETAITVPTPPGSAAVTVPAPGTPSKTAFMPDLAGQETLQPAQLAAQMERRKDEVLRFGRGVAPLPPPRPAETSPMWDERLSRPRPRSRWRTRIFALLSTLTTLVLLAVVAWWLIQRLMPLEISSVEVALAEPLGNKCDVEAKVVGTIKTNGAGGTITYRWLTSDGKTTSELPEYVNLGETQVTVTLTWTFSGQSTLDAKATLQILSPVATEQSTEFTYSCAS